jgi:hypothetical protein
MAAMAVLSAALEAYPAACPVPAATAVTVAWSEALASVVVSVAVARWSPDLPSLVLGGDIRPHGLHGPWGRIYLVATIVNRWYGR